MLRADAYDAIVDPTRRSILDLLRHGEQPVGDLVTALGVAQPNVSKHLRTLDAAGLVQVRVDGPRRLYSLVPTGFEPLEEWLAPFRETWADRLDTLARRLDAMPDDGPRPPTSSGSAAPGPAS